MACTLFGYGLRIVWSIGVAGPHSDLLSMDPLLWEAVTGGAGRPLSCLSRTSLVRSSPLLSYGRLRMLLSAVLLPGWRVASHGCR